MDAEASRILRNSFAASSPPCAAIRDDEKPPSAPVRGADIRHQFWRDLLIDEFAQRPRIDEALGRAAACLEHVSGCDFRVTLAQCFVVLLAGERKWRHQRAGADAGDHRVIRALATRGQSVEQAGAKGAVGAAAREDQPRPGFCR
jgi:hypothetical protein